MKKYLIILFIFSLQFCENSRQVKDSQWYKKTSLSDSKNLLLDKDWQILDSTISFPKRIKIKDSLLFIQDRKSNYVIKVVYLKSKKIYEFGKKGKGPNEILSPYGSLSFEKNKLFLLDPTLKKIVAFSFDNGETTLNDLFLDKGSSIYEFGIIGDNEIVGLDFHESNNRLIFYNLKNGSATRNGSLPPKPNKEIPTTIHKQSFMGTLGVKPDGTKIVVASLYSDLIEIFDNSGDEIIKVKTEFDFLPKYELSNNNGHIVMGQGLDTKFGYIDVAVSEDKIYALYSGNTREIAPFAYGKFIHIYDWEGNFLNTYKIEKEATALEVDTQNNYIYTVNNESGSLISRYIF